MIEYHRLEADGGPRDVVLTTDDNNAEMALLSDMLKECEFEGINLPDDPEQDGKFHVTIPGNQVGEFSECVYDIDDGKLQNLTDKWNHQMLSELDDDA